MQSAMLVVMVAKEGHGRSRNVMEGLFLSSDSQSSEKSYGWFVQSAMLVCAVGYVGGL